MTTQATPAQLVFGRDAILNTTFDMNWKIIRDHKQRAIQINNCWENAKRTPYDYKVGEKVLYRNDDMSKYGRDSYEGPYKIVRVNTNGTVQLRMGHFTDTVNIRLIKPYRE
jgi:protein associated with RNAse G/E